MWNEEDKGGTGVEWEEDEDEIEKGPKSDSYYIKN